MGDLIENLLLSPLLRKSRLGINTFRDQLWVGCYINAAQGDIMKTFPYILRVRGEGKTTKFSFLLKNFFNKKAQLIDN